MRLNEFSEKIKNKLKYMDINISEDQVLKFYNYMNLLIEWNQKMNLTAITEPDEIIIKHFIDSITICKYIDKNSNILDVGTGAGFPGIPIKIIRDDISIILMDSLNKRITFLEEIIKKLNLNNISAIHARAEELGHNKEYRKKFDYITSRAVAPLNYLVEYMIPFAKIDGSCICMKGYNISDEVKEAENAITRLGGIIDKIEKIILPETDIERNIIIIKKIKGTPEQYPRKPGIPKRQPIVI